MWHNIGERSLGEICSISVEHALHRGETTHFLSSSMPQTRSHMRSMWLSNLARGCGRESATAWRLSGRPSLLLEGWQCRDDTPRLVLELLSADGIYANKSVWSPATSPDKRFNKYDILLFLLCTEKNLFPSLHLNLLRYVTYSEASSNSPINFCRIDKEPVHSLTASSTQPTLRWSVARLRIIS